MKSEHCKGGYSSPHLLDGHSPRPAQKKRRKGRNDWGVIPTGRFSPDHSPDSSPEIPRSEKKLSSKERRAHGHYLKGGGFLGRQIYLEHEEPVSAQKSAESSKSQQLFDDFWKKLSCVNGTYEKLSEAELEKAKYVFSRAVFHYEQSICIDLSKLSFTDLLCPERTLPKSVAQCEDNTLQRASDSLCGKIRTRFTGSYLSTPRTIQLEQIGNKLIECADAMSDMRRMLPFLARLGATIEQKLQRPVPPVLQEQEKYGIKVVSKGITRRERLSNYSSYPFCAHQEYKFLKTTSEAADSVPKLPDVMCEALEELSGNGFSPCAAPTFLGYLIPEFANEWARENGLIDHNCALNFSHGNHTHVMQGAYLSGRCMDKETLKNIVDYKKWDFILDSNCFQDVGVYSCNMQDDSLKVSGLNLSLQAHSPNCIYEKLLTGQLSEAVGELSRASDIEGYLPYLSNKLDKPSLTQDDLTEMARNLEILENYTACMAVKDRQEIRASVDFYVSDADLDVGSMGDFRDSGDRGRSVVATATRFYSQGRKMLGYREERLPSAAGKVRVTKAFEINNVEDIGKGCAFVVLPENTTNLVIPEHARRFFPQYEQNQK